MASASAMMPSRAAASSLLPRLSTPVLFSSRFASLHIRQLSLPLLPKVSMAIPAISLNLPSLPSLQEIWDGLLKAVPKKKVSHSKRRHRQMAGKALKDTTSLCRCPACGNVKRMHYLCSPCAGKFTGMMGTMNKTTTQSKDKQAAATVDKKEGKEE